MPVVPHLENSTVCQPQGSLRSACRSAGPAVARRTGLYSLKEIHAFYRDGFRSMILGRTLWKLIVLKLFIMFAVLRLFFLPNFLHKNFANDAQRSAHVLENLTGGAGR